MGNSWPFPVLSTEKDTVSPKWSWDSRACLSKSRHTSCLLKGGSELSDRSVVEAKRANGRKEETAEKARGADVCAAGMQSGADNLILWLEVKEEKVIDGEAAVCQTLLSVWMRQLIELSQDL